MDYPGVSLIDFKLQHVIGTCTLPYRILLEQLALKYPTECTYEPELYPAAAYHMQDPQVTVLIFATGKLVLKGSKHSLNIQQACDKIVPILMEFKDEKTL